jgi:dihydrodipicolinate synthase/N-acetylneuraminate lyase
MENISNLVKDVICPVPALYKDDLTIDLKAMSRHLDFLLSKEVPVLYLAQAASEWEWMTREERIDITKLVVSGIQKSSNKKTVLMAQPIGKTNIIDHIEEARMLEDLGVDVLVIAPIPIKLGGQFFSGSFNRGGYQRERHDSYYSRYMEEFAHSVSTPICFHNFPPAPGKSLAFETLEEITNIPLVAGIKEHNKELATRKEVYSRFGDKVLCFEGFAKEDFFWAIQYGAKARHSNWSWFDPEWDIRFSKNLHARDYRTVVGMIKAETEFGKVITETGYAGYKAVLEAEGFQGGLVRIPGLNISLEEKREVAMAWKKHKEIREEIIARSSF